MESVLLSFRSGVGRGSLFAWAFLLAVGCSDDRRVGPTLPDVAVFPIVDTGAPTGDAGGPTKPDLPTSLTCQGDADCQALLEGQPCLEGRCEPSTQLCVFDELSGPCLDGNPCTTDDSCLGGVCVGQPYPCDDDNPCTEDSCNPASGCVHATLTGPCDDGDGCTDNDQCTQGKCVGQATGCDDANPCTKDSCDPVNGCRHEPADGPCDDYDPCTDNDKCAAGICVGTHLPGCDPTGCAQGEVKDCGGICAAAGFIGDGTCHDGSAGPDFDCAAFSFDQGDCAQGCSIGQFECNDGSCISQTAKCDGTPDCPGGEDELGCLGCQADEFECNDGQCIPEFYVCDYLEDCAGGEDEVGCGPCPTGEIVDCDGGCTPESWLGDDFCDSWFDCEALDFDAGDCSDECAPDEFECDDGECLWGSWQCDGFDDCSGGEDEFGCPCGTFDIEDCNGGCYWEMFLGNGLCDEEFNCAELNYDEGDCP